MHKSMLAASPISIALTTLWINWGVGVVLIMMMLCCGCLACQAWLLMKTVRSRLAEIPEEKRTQVRLRNIRNGVRTQLPALMA
ncbi:hypothetical protein FJZ28_04580 [Candidatus Peregrinibacteria bacterium]|nr:hypothetical protein [Candidatus Peregrinibacteria bacterium]